MQQYDKCTNGGWFFSINEEQKKAWGADEALQARGNESYKILHEKKKAVHFHVNTYI